MYTAIILSIVLLVSFQFEVESVDFAGFRRAIDQSLPSCDENARAWLRAAFHDSGSFSRNDQKPVGADGSLQFELDRSENMGLARTISVYTNFVKQFNVSMADCIAYGAARSVEVCSGVRVNVTLGRIDATEANPPDRLPGATQGANATFQMFVNRMGFTLEETIALIGGAHSVARVHANFHQGESWIGNRRANWDIDSTVGKLDNVYFKQLLNSTLRGLPSDYAMTTSLDMLKVVENFATNSSTFLRTFKSAVERMINLGARFFDASYLNNLSSSSGSARKTTTSSLKSSTKTATGTTTRSVVPPRGRATTTVITSSKTKLESSSTKSSGIAAPNSNLAKATSEMRTSYTTVSVLPTSVSKTTTELARDVPELPREGSARQSIPATTSPTSQQATTSSYSSTTEITLTSSSYLSSTTLTVSGTFTAGSTSYSATTNELSLSQSSAKSSYSSLSSSSATSSQTSSIYTASSTISSLAASVYTTSANDYFAIAPKPTDTSKPQLQSSSGWTLYQWSYAYWIRLGCFAAMLFYAY
jgi:hypothetical protein